MKRNVCAIVSTALAFVILMTTMPLTAFALNSGFTYTYLSGGRAAITGYIGSDTAITIPDTVGGYSVVAIGDEAFCEYYNLTSVVIPDGVTVIGNGAFSCCYNLTSVDVPDGVTTIGDRAFYKCDQLRNITIPDSVTTLGNEVFYACTWLPNATIPDGVTAIGDRMFYECYRLASIEIPDSVKTIGTDAFYDCNALTSVTMPDGLTTIGDYAFLGCERLASAVIPDSVVTLGKFAFSNCERLAKVTIGEGITVISECAFKECKALTDIEIPNHVTTIGEAAFYGCPGLTTVTIPDSVTSIEDYAFQGCGNLTTVTISDSVTSIGNYAFDTCGSLQNVTFGKGLTTISDRAFSNTGLTNITIPNGVTTIGVEAFYACDELNRVSIPDSVTLISDRAFYYCTNLQAVHYGGSKADWYNIAFGKGNDNLIKATILYNTIGYGSNIRYSYYILPDYTIQIVNYKGSNELLVIPSTIDGFPVTSIGDEAFYDDRNLKGVIIPEGVTSIGARAFYSCNVLKTIMLPSTLTTVDLTAFSDCIPTHIFFTGTKAQWKAVVDFLPIEEATYHYAVTSDTLAIKTPAPHCTVWYDVSATCTICNKRLCTETDVVPPIGHHVFEENACIHCGIALAEHLCSSHPYSNSTDETKTVIQDGAVSVSVTFSDETYVEEDYDFIYIYDKNDTLVGTYTGAQLAGQTITVMGDTVKVQLVSDSTENAYGYVAVSMTFQEGMLGDIDGNAAVNMRDVMALYTAVSKGRVLTEEQQLLADFDGNGVINIRDVMAFYKQLAKG